MRILVTNDDGIGAEGLVALTETLSRDHEVWIFAPDKERSGVSHALTLGSPEKVREVARHSYSCSGTPSDCVVLALLGAIGFKPEIVVSGINRGPNLGTDIVYSGTCAAAREAVIAGVPGIAVSCASRESHPQYGAAVAFVSDNLERLVDACTSEAFVNINAPSSDSLSLGARWTLPCTRIYGNGLRSFEGPDGFGYFFLTSGDSTALDSETSDYSAVAKGMISVSPILVLPQVPAGFLSSREFG
jgi:5'-nucleotidase